MCSLLSPIRFNEGDKKKKVTSKRCSIGRGTINGGCNGCTVFQLSLFVFVYWERVKGDTCDPPWLEYK